MLKKIMLITFSILTLNVTSQVVQNIDWIKYYSDADTIENVASALDANNTVFTTGYIYVSTTNVDLIVQKRDSTGTLLWTYTYNNGGTDKGKAIRIDASGNVYVTGVSDGSGKDYVTIKLNSSGTQQWVTRMNNFGTFNDEAYDLQVDASGNVYVTGSASASGGGHTDMVTVKYNSSGVQQWKNTYAGPATNSFDSGLSLVLASNGSTVYVTGTNDQTGTNSNIVTRAISASAGTAQWTTVFNGTSSGTDRGCKIILAGANVVICGEAVNTTTGRDHFIAKYNGSNGTSMWSNSYDNGNYTNAATDVVKDSTGNLVITGYVFNGSTYAYHTVMYDSSGTQHFVNVENTGLSSITVNPHIACDTIAHHFYVSGEIMKITRDIFVYQIAPSGNSKWKQTIDGNNYDFDAATNLVVNGVGVVYVTALSKNTSARYDITTIKINQTPLYFPPDFAGQTANKNHLYLKNQGQLLKTNGALASEVLYYTINAKPEVYIEKDAFDFVFRKTDENRPDTAGTATDTLERIRYRFLGSNSFANHHEYTPTGPSYNYYLGYAANSEIEGIKGNERVFVPNFYPYIDLHYFSGPTGIKYYLVVKPGALLDGLNMEIDGASSTSIDGTTGNLKINGVLGNVELNRPVAYTVNMLGQVVNISGSASWANSGSNTYNIIPPTYTPTLPLIIQISSAATSAAPNLSVIANLDYSTYYGGQGNDRFNDIKVASNGDRHVTGNTDALTFPNVNSVQGYQGNSDIIFMKYTADDTLRYASFMGGSNADVGNSIGVNSAGEVFVGGQTFSTNYYFKYLAGASNQTVNGTVGNTSLNFTADGFLFKFAPSNPPGQQMVWSRYVGGSRSDCINGIFVDASGNLYLAGYADSPDLTTVNANQSTMGTWNVQYNRDAIFGKINTSLQTQWLTYYGAATNGTNTTSAYEEGTDIVVDNSGRVIGSGWTETLATPMGNSTGNSNTFYSSTKKGVTDGFLIRYSTSGTPDFRTFFGGNGADKITRLVYKSWYDQIYFAGESDSAHAFPFYTMSGATNSQYQAKRNAFVGYMDGSLTKQWCSYYGKGKNKTYSVTGLSVDENTLVYLSGFTDNDTLQYPTNYPTTVVYKDSILQGSEDGFVAIFSGSKSLYHAHYFGGSSGDKIMNSDIDGNQRLWVVGNTTSGNFPIAYTSSSTTLIDDTQNGANDGFISRFELEHYQITGIKDVSFDKSLLSVYPNPSNSQFYVELEGELKSRPLIQIFNLMGQLIHEETINGNVTKIACESWANGVYLIKIGNNEAQSTFKLIKN